MTDRPDNKDEIIKKQYGIQPYAQREFPLSPEVRYHDYIAEEDVHLRDYINVILKRKSIVLTFFVAIVVTTTIFSFLMIPVYRSTVTVKIDDQTPSAFSIPGSSFYKVGKDYYQTQYELLKSRSLAEKVIKKLELDKNPYFLPAESKFSKATNVILKPVKSAAASFVSLFEADNDNNVASSSGKEELPTYLSGALTSRLEVMPVKDSQLLNITFESNNPELSMLITNVIADAYIEYDLESRIDSSRQSKDF
jgi:uncharacterized protein involved in exopolysaccharide biosynthesis